jgi:hypothetical protein
MAAAVPFARSGFGVLIDFSIPPASVDTARKVLKEVPFDFVLLRPSLQLCVERAASREEGAIAAGPTYRRGLESGAVRVI